MRTTTIRRGLSLLEIIVAAGILATLFTFLFSGIHSGFQGTRRLAEENFATNHAISLVEALTLVPLGSLPDIPAGTPCSSLDSYLSAVPEFTWNNASNPDYPRTVEVRQVSKRTARPDEPGNSPYGALKLIRVEVSWKARYLKTQPTKRFLFQTLVTDDAEVAP